MEELTQTEQLNLQTVKEYMDIAYSFQKCKGKESVIHLVASQNKFIAPTTFPTVSTVEGYAEEHINVMKCLPDLHIVSYDFECVKGNKVALRYSAEGTFTGEPYKNKIKPSGVHACWTASALFELDDNGKIKLFIKDWDKLSMWNQLGWPIDDCIVNKKAQ
ncbi:hypothetical protein ABK040_016137 [Willaertia magna]